MEKGAICIVIERAMFSKVMLLVIKTVQLITVIFCNYLSFCLL